MRSSPWPGDRHAQVARDRELGDAVAARVDAHEQDRVRAPRPAVGAAVGSEHERRRGVREQRAAGRERGPRARVDALVGVVHGAAELPVAVADPEQQHEQRSEHGEQDQAPGPQPPARAAARGRREGGGPAGAAAGPPAARRRPGALAAAPAGRSADRGVARAGGSSGGAAGRHDGRGRRRPGGVRSRALLDRVRGFIAPPAVDPERRLGVVPGHGGTLPALRGALERSHWDQLSVGRCSPSSRRRSATCATSRCGRSMRCARPT